MFTAILGLLLPTINKALDFIPNPQEREKAKLELQTKLMAQELEVMKVLAQADTNQTEINKEEAKEPFNILVIDDDETILQKHSYFPSFDVTEQLTYLG